MNKKIINVTAVIAKVFEIVLWIAAASMITGSIATIVAGEFMGNILKSVLNNDTLTFTGFDICVIAADGTLNKLALIFALIAGIMGMVFGALICRNIYQIFKTEKPFCNDNIQRVHRIGIYAIAIPIYQIILSSVIGIIGLNSVEVNIDATTIFFGLVVLYLSQFFKYGANLEEDVDGLL